MNEYECEIWANHIKTRLINIVDNRPYVFKDTKRKSAEEYLTRRKQFLGMSYTEIQTLEHQLSLSLPLIFKAYLRVMGRKQGLLFWGSESNPDAFMEYRIWAEEIIQEDQISSFLNPKSVIFMFHQGFAFRYFEVTSPRTDTPVWKYLQHHGGLQFESQSFKDYIESEISRSEGLNNKERDKGGYYLIVGDKGGYRSEFPKTNNEIPLLIGDRFIR